MGHTRKNLHDSRDYDTENTMGIATMYTSGGVTHTVRINIHIYNDDNEWIQEIIYPPRTFRSRHDARTRAYRYIDTYLRAYCHMAQYAYDTAKEKGVSLKHKPLA